MMAKLATPEMTYTQCRAQQLLINARRRAARAARGDIPRHDGQPDDACAPVPL